MKPTYILYAFYAFIAIVAISLFQKLFPPNKVVEIKTNQSTLTSADAKAYADILHAAMNQYGTDEDMIFQSLSGLNGEDYKAIFNAFGMRHYDVEFGLNLMGSWGEKYNLSTWLTNELNESELQVLKDQFGTSFP